MSAIKKKYLCAWSSARTQLQISFEKCSLRDEPSLKKSMTREICVGAYNRLEIVLPQKLKVAAGRSRTVTPHRAAFRVLLISHEHRTCTWGKTCARPIHHLGRWEKKKKNDVRGSDTVTRLVTPVRRAVSPRRFSPPLRRERERARAEACSNALLFHVPLPRCLLALVLRFIDYARRRRCSRFSVISHCKDVFVPSPGLFYLLRFLLLCAIIFFLFISSGLILSLSRPDNVSRN